MLTPVGPNAPTVGKPTVLLLPIAAPSGSYNWVGRAIQQDVEVDLAQMGIARVIAPASGPQADDADAALKAARESGASHVVYATAQVSGSQIRVTGQVLDASDGHVLSPIKMTAPADNLFPLEDGLSAQIAQALPGGPEAMASAAQAQNQATQPANKPMPTVVYGQPSSSTNTAVQTPQYYTSTDNTPHTTNTYVYTQPYDYDYGYPYSYGYPYYGYPGVYIGGFGFYGGHYYNHYRSGGYYRGGGFRGGLHGGIGFRGGSGGFHGGGHFGGGHR